MRHAFRIVIMSCFCIAVGLSALTAHAQWGCGYGFWGAYGYNVYSQEDLPYFAKHPPVYYSRPVARSYGWSPFAYPGFVATPAAPVAHHSNPVMVLNPFFKKAESDASPAGAAPATEQTMQTVHRTQVIYPSDLASETRLASRDR